MKANPAAVNRAANARMAWAANMAKMTKSNPGIWAAVAEAENPLSMLEIDHLSLAFDAIAEGKPYGQHIRSLYDLHGNPNEAAVLTEIANALARAEDADAPDLVFEALEYARLLLRRLPEGSEGRATMKERLVQAVQRHVDLGNLEPAQRDFLTGKLKINPGVTTPRKYGRHAITGGGRSIVGGDPPSRCEPHGQLCWGVRAHNIHHHPIYEGSRRIGSCEWRDAEEHLNDNTGVVIAAPHAATPRGYQGHPSDTIVTELAVLTANALRRQGVSTRAILAGTPRTKRDMNRRKGRGSEFRKAVEDQVGGRE